MDADQFQNYLESNIALTKLMQFQLQTLAPDKAVGKAPLTVNDNHRGSAFGGSLYNCLVLTSYSWLSGGLLKGDPSVAPLIQKAEVEYLEEVREEIQSVCQSPGQQDVESFLKVFLGRGKSRIDLVSEIRSSRDQRVLARLKGRFVALKKTESGDSE